MPRFLSVTPLSLRLLVEILIDQADVFFQQPMHWPVIFLINPLFAFLMRRVFVAAIFELPALELFEQGLFRLSVFSARLLAASALTIVPEIFFVFPRQRLSFFLLLVVF